MRAHVLALFTVASAVLAPHAAAAQRHRGVQCDSTSTHYVARCLGHILVRSGAIRARVFVDGTDVGLTPALVSITAARAHRVEVRAPGAEPWQHTVRPSRGTITPLDAPARGRSSIESLSWAVFARFDECDGYSDWSTPNVDAMEVHRLQRLRDQLSSNTARRALPTSDAMFAALEASCAAATASSCTLAGRALERGDWEPNPRVRSRRERAGGPIVALDSPQRAALALDRWTRACTLGDAAGCVDAARARLSGATQSPLIATQLYDRACALGDAASCCTLGERLERGDGAPRDPARARTLFTNGCATHQYACCRRITRLRPPTP